MRNTSGRTSSMGPWLGGTVIGVALSAAFLAGHQFWPAQLNGLAPPLAVNSTTTKTPAGVIENGPPIGENTVANVAELANKSVVNIDTTSSVTISESPFPQNFGFFLGPGMGGAEGAPRKFQQHAAGSGFIYRADGYILTNYHVVKNNPQNIKVTLADKRVFDGKIVGTDTYTDLAIIKIDATGLPESHLGSSKTLRPGDWVIAIGSPIGLDHSVTLGIISALNRSVNGINNVELIQTDAAINPGNSGGPLLNIHGEVIGVNNAIRGDAQNIGFAIPVDIAKDVAEQLASGKSIKRAYLGIYMQDLDEKVAKALGLSANTKGVIIAKIAADGPADKSGLEQNDIITRVDGNPVASGKEVQEVVRKHHPGDKFDVLVNRNGQVTPVTVTVGDFPNQEERQQ